MSMDERVAALVREMPEDEFRRLREALMGLPEGRLVTEVAANILEHAAASAESAVLRGGMPLEDWIVKVREGVERLRAGL